jgi:CBS domain-containing protein
MLVKDLMTRPVQTCRPTTSVGAAAEIMRDARCGCLPVTDAHGKLLGIVTDRDVCLLVARRRNPLDVPVSDIMSADVLACHPGDHVDVPLVAMKENGVRRVPVVDARDHVKGIISIDDVIRHTGPDTSGLPGEAVLDVLRHICERESPVPAVAG